MSEALVIARQTIAQQSKSFALASRVFPLAVRDRAVILYTWCRRADDAIDLALPENRAGALARLRAEIDQIYAGEPQADSVNAAFQELVFACEIPRSYPDELLAGMEMDVSGQRYRTLSQLLQYCYRVAGVVGLMMAHVMGVRDERALRNAAHMGIGMQLTNICRDIHEDWRLGRIYLPDELLARYAVADLADQLGGPFPQEARRPVAGVVRDLLSHADSYYASGDAGLGALSWRCALAVRAARLVYSRIGRRVLGQACDPLAGRAVVPGWRKLLLVGAAGLSGLRELPGRLWRSVGARRARLAVPKRQVRFPHDILPI